MAAGMGTAGLHRGPPALLSGDGVGRRGSVRLLGAGKGQRKAQLASLARARSGAGGSVPTMGAAGKPQWLRALPSPARRLRSLPPRELMEGCRSRN